MLFRRVWLCCGVLRLFNWVMFVVFVVFGLYCIVLCGAFVCVVPVRIVSVLVCNSVCCRCTVQSCRCLSVCVCLSYLMLFVCVVLWLL